MIESAHERVMARLSEIIAGRDWDRLPEVLHDDAVFEYPQSGERFRGIANIRAQFENYPDLGPRTSQLSEVIGDATWAIAPSYTLVRVDGAGGRGTGVIRVRYPDGSWWWAINLFELRDDRIALSRTYFASDFEAPDWRAPYRETP